MTTEIQSEDDFLPQENAPTYSLPAPGKRRILILTADAGFGHRSAANAVASALEEKYGDACTVLIANPLDDRRAPFFLRESQSDYDRLVRNMPELYRLGFDASDATVPAVIVEQALTVLLFEVMRDLVRSYRPDVILSTYPLYQAPLRAVMTVYRLSIPIMVAITDLATIHRLWFNNGVDLCFVPTEIARDLALEAGLSPEQIMVCGLPVNPAIVRDQRSPMQIRADLNLREDLLTVLAVGSRRVDRLMETLNVINHFGAPLQLIVVAGKDEELYRQLNAAEWHLPVRLYDYYPNVPELMKAADWIMCKAGGLVVTEALACGRPLMIIDAIPGQEIGNAEYVVRNGAGDLALSGMEVLEATAHLLMDNRWLLRQRTQNAQRLGRPNAAYDIAEAVWGAAQRRAMRWRRGTGRLRLIDLLSRNQVHWEEE